MEVIIVLLISALLTLALSYVDTMLQSIVPICLNAESYMTTYLGNGGFQNAFNLIFNFGVSLIVLKFLKKGFDIYVAWQDGDADADPVGLLTNFFRAMVVAIGFPTLYQYLADIVSDLTNKLLIAIGMDMNQSFATYHSSLTSLNVFTAIVSLVFFICFFFLYIQFLTRGLEILILRIGMPIACVGLIDSDKGVFGSYIKKFFQSTLTVVVQLALAKLSVGLFLNSHIFWGIAAITLSLKTPKFLQEFMLVSGGGGGGISNKIYHTSRLYQMAKSVFAK